MIQPPSVLTALVCIAASGTLYGSQRSDAPRGSVRQWASRNCGSSSNRLNHFSCKCLGANWRSSTETFQFCTSLSASPESPRAISSEMTAKVLTSVPFSSSRPPNSSGTPRVRMPTFSAPSRMLSGKRDSGVIDHSCFQFALTNGMTTSSTKSRQLCRIILWSSVNPRSCMCITSCFRPLRMPSAGSNLILIWFAGLFQGGCPSRTSPMSISRKECWPWTISSN